MVHIIVPIILQAPLLLCARIIFCFHFSQKYSVFYIQWRTQEGAKGASAITAPPIGLIMVLSFYNKRQNTSLNISSENGFE